MMNMEMNLLQKQTLKLVMTQELRQAISLLQYSTTELQDYIDEMSLENPLMEIEKQEPTVDPEMAFSSPVIWNDEEVQTQEQEEQEERSIFETISNQSKSIVEELVQQIREQNVSDDKRVLYMYIARHVGDDGYLKIDGEEAADELNASAAEIEEAVRFIQCLEPAGIGARTVQECLLLQLARRQDADPLAETLIQHHLEDLASRKWKQIAKAQEVSLERIQQAHDFIQTLEPRPVCNYGVDSPGHLVPDVHVEYIEGEWSVYLNDSSLPRIRMNRHYRKLLQQASDSDAFDYAAKKYKQLTWLLKSIDQRQQTLQRVTEEIVACQVEFFEKGAAYLKPLTLKDIAEKAEVHESTVSRATTHKYVQTPRGLFELKDFFSSSVEHNQNGEQTSSAVIKSWIESYVEAEDKRKPLSDQKIVQKLKEDQQINVSRRAIAKYRDALSIPSSSKRKRFD
ncbi:RNA polymerase factor sigma-54 [Salsuginibacillus kocurii]|uniref:RNA polymerase factor sigma-54 n=1 Tax=Salsuginibacillus kocurii TaxID=427078 RepID=UPI00036B151A|nr:RNA polymerase factor sigma-54 [Salsuginibacillus kocurii]